MNAEFQHNNKIPVKSLQKYYLIQLNSYKYQNKIIQQMTTQLTKPQFVKVSDLANARSGYNVYVKVISVDKS